MLDPWIIEEIRRREEEEREHREQPVLEIPLEMPVYPNQGGTPMSKIPSKIAYNTQSPKWGAQVGPTDEPQASLFKLGLEGKTRHYYQSPKVKGNNVNKKPVEIAADFLTAIYQHVHDQFNKQFGQNYLNSLEISYVNTVPAISSNYAQNVTNEAARRAGISSNKISLITRPEAVANWYSASRDRIDPKEGD